jgi:hypothetical protein
MAGAQPRMRLVCEAVGHAGQVIGDGAEQPLALG